MNSSSLSLWRLAFTGFCIMCLALGLARFAYTPLLPIMVNKHWLTETVAGYIGSANFLGYLCGALIAKWLTRFQSSIFWIKFSLILCLLSLCACIIHWDTAWLLCWRTIAGLSGAVLMVLTPPVIYKGTHKHHIALVSGVMFGGIGMGIIYGALIVPALSTYSVTLIWATIAALGLLLTVYAWFNLPSAKPKPSKTALAQLPKATWSVPIILVFIAYLIFGYGAVPHLLYMVDYIEQGLNGSILIANIGWLIYGIGNTIGSPIFGYISKHIGMKKSLMITYLIASLSLFILFTTNHPWIGLVSYALNGIIANSIVSLTSSYLTQLGHHSQQTYYWGIFTVFVALTQTSGSAIMANWISSATGFQLMFFTSGVTMLMAALLIFFIKKS